MSNIIHMFDCGLQNRFAVSTEKIAREICMRAVWTIEDWPDKEFRIDHDTDFFGNTWIYLQTRSGNFIYNVTEEKCCEYMKVVANEFFNLCKKIEELIEEIDQKGEG